VGGVCFEKYGGKEGGGRRRGGEEREGGSLGERGGGPGVALRSAGSKGTHYLGKKKKSSGPPTNRRLWGLRSDYTKPTIR